ncbi:signal transduction histidine kinase [Paenibacillus swuensis]|uniref:Signal transduction histidine kinase n=1 Tax=Paenibacillus swuensis TaxID=1178515 RepID=A0A172TMV8_9BACL|nr:hypothetical protein [Paenibacillus swuensis]ANE48306.1 signal transduction histidine kinase [Paenibacillus swuensis]
MFSEINLLFIIVAFSFALVLILSRNNIAPGFRRGLALAAIVMVAFAFFLLVYSFFNMGT